METVANSQSAIEPRHGRWSSDVVLIAIRRLHRLPTAHTSANYSSWYEIFRISPKRCLAEASAFSS